MKKLFILLILAVTSQLVLANIDYCETTNLIVKQLVNNQLGPSGLSSAGQCIVSGRGEVKVVQYAYRTIFSRRNDVVPVSYKARVAHDEKSDMYYLCEISYFPNDPGSKIETVSTHWRCQ